MEILHHLDVPGDATAEATAALEAGRILFAPHLHFELSASERRFLSPAALDAKSKNVSYRPATGALGGTNCQGQDRADLQGMLRRYHDYARALLERLCPAYRDHLLDGFTSFRPAEISGRATSWRKDDTRLHVDAFPSRPVHGDRILRVFTNVNPSAPRIWRVGDAFEEVAARFLPAIPPPLPGLSWWLRTLRVTKTRRTAYDHFMLGIHDRMKAGEQYQRDAPQTPLEIAPGVTWACFTDQVSHAAMAGQFAFEQTFYLPVSGMLAPELSPLRVLERRRGCVLA
jgi:hypothetical protein